MLAVNSPYLEAKHPASMEKQHPASVEKQHPPGTHLTLPVNTVPIFSTVTVEHFTINKNHETHWKTSRNCCNLHACLHNYTCWTTDTEFRCDQQVAPWAL